MSSIPPLEPIGDDGFTVAGVQFTTTWNKGSTADHFNIRKSLPLAEALAAFLADHLDANIVELGIAQGGSTALTELVGRPRRLVSIEFDARPVDGLTEFIEQRGIGDRVRTHYGVNQADRLRVAGIVDEEFGDEPLDLVIDDASHLLAETTSSFETLFPRLRPGGRYLIEDWAWQQQTMNRFAATLEGPPGPARSAAEQAIHESLVRALADPSDPWHDEAVRRLGGDAATAEPVASGGSRSTVARSGNEQRPLIRLVHELLLVNIAHPATVPEVVVDEWWVKVRRGPEPLDRETFRVASLYRDHLDLLR